MADISKVKLPDNVTYNLKDSGAVRKTGDTMTGNLILYREGTTTQNYPTQLFFQNKDTTTGKTSQGVIKGYDGGEYGLNMVISPAGNMFIGSGESADNHYALYPHNTGENFYATADGNMYLQSNGGTIANRVGMGIYTDHSVRPVKADTNTNNIGSIGTSSYRWAGMYAMKYNGLLTGTGTAGQDKGSGVTNRYVPAKWTFNIGSNTASEGDLFVIKLPVAGHDYGTYLSLDNGTNYYPVIYNTSTRLTTHFPVGSCIIVTFDSAGSAGSIFPLNGGDARTTVSGGAFRVIDFYDSGNSNVTQTATTANANYEVLFSVTADNTTRTEGARKNSNLTFNPSTGTLTTTTFVGNLTGNVTGNCSGSSGSCTGNAATATSTKKLANYYDSRPTDCDLLLGDGSLRTFQATSSMSSNKPAIGDAHIIHLAWDNSNGYDGQIALKNSGAAMMCRAQSNKTWGSWMPIGVFTQATPTTGQVVITDGTVGGIKSSGYTIAKSVPSNAVFTDTNDAVAVTNTNPSSGTWYYPVWYTATSGTGGVKANDGFRHYSLQGTASAVGRSIISLGNNTATGTAGNKRGELFLYSEKSGRAEIVYDAAATATVTHTFPATAGTILNTGTTSFTQSLSSGTKIGTIKINGTSTDLYCQTNTNTHRPIQVNGTEILGNNTTALNLAAGSNVSITNAGGTVAISATNTNNAVTQTATTTDADYDILFSASTTGTTTKTEGARKDSKIAYNPNKGCLKLYNTGADTDKVLQIYSTTIDGTTTLNEEKFSVTNDGTVWCSTLSATNIQGGTAINTQYKDTTTNTTGFCMHGRTNGNKYSCIWSSSKLNFYVDTTNVGNVSDRQLKSEIDEIDPRLLEAIAECKIYQYKAFNRDGLISVGIMAQDLVEKCEEKGIRPENYELLTKMNFIQGDDTLYYSVDYNQYATFMINYLQNEIKELKTKIEK